MKKSTSLATTPASVVSRKIYFLRGMQVMIDADLAQLYGVTTANLNQAVRRNPERFPDDFMFELSRADLESLIFQTGRSKKTGRGGRRYLPLAFTEQGVAMLSSVLRSERAVKVNIAIMRAFVQLRQMLATNEDLRRKIEEMEKRYDAKFQIVFSAIKRMLEASKPTKSMIGFHAGGPTKTPAKQAKRRQINH
jgi:ORF6N domain